MTKDRYSYIVAYTQVNYFIQNLPKQYLSKLPNNLINFIKEQSSNDYVFDVDSSKSLFMQNYSDKAKALIAVLKYNYWSNDDEKRKLKILLENNEHNYYNKQEIYNNSFLFKNYSPDAFANDNELTISVTSSSSFIIYLKRFLLKVLKIIK